MYVHFYGMRVNKKFWKFGRTPRWIPSVWYSSSSETNRSLFAWVPLWFFLLFKSSLPNIITHIKVFYECFPSDWCVWNDCKESQFQHMLAECKEGVLCTTKKKVFWRYTTPPFWKLVQILLVWPPPSICTKCKIRRLFTWFTYLNTLELIEKKISQQLKPCIFGFLIRDTLYARKLFVRAALA